MKVIEINDADFVWHVPLSAVASNRAEYYAKRDEDTTYQEEFDYVMDDSFEALDWYQNNMDFSDIADMARLVQTPTPKGSPGSDARHCVRDVPEWPPLAALAAHEGETP